MTMTDEAKAETDTPDETPDNVIVAEPRPVAVGDVVTKTVHPQIYDGLVLHVDTVLVGGVRRAWLVGRRDEGGDWHLIRAEVDSLARRELAGDTPGYPEIGAALAAKQADIERATEQVAEARAEVLAATTALTTRNTRVRDEIISHGDDHDWDNDDVNSLLDSLGLDGVEREWSINVDVTATQSVYVTVSAASLDDAIDMVENDRDLVAGVTSSYDWEMGDYEVDRYNSGEAD